jgi:hypothetical protein
VRDLTRLYLDVHARFAGLASRADQLHAEDDGWEPDPEDPYLWFERLSNAINQVMVRGEVRTDIQQLFAFISNAFLSGDEELYKCIDVAFVENLFWQVPVAQCDKYWSVLPDPLQKLYIGFFGRLPSALPWNQEIKG